jgi:hypothetical protein
MIADHQPESSKKARNAIGPELVPVVFSDERIRDLAHTSKLPAGTDVQQLAKSVREAARIYVSEARLPSDNELHREIKTLHRAATRREYEWVAILIEKLSARAGSVLANRRGPSLPPPSALRDVAQRERACATVAALCHYGGKEIEGRCRPSGKRSLEWRPLLYAPEPSRHFPKRAAERNFVMWLSIAWLEAVGSPAPRRAHHLAPGPFARFVKECLRLVGTPNADAVELINQLAQRRHEMERRREHKTADACHLSKPERD